MSEWVLYYLIATLTIGVLSEVVGAALLLVVAGRGAAAGVRRVTGRQPAGSAVCLPCGSVDCRGLRTVHHVTASGLRCAECGHIPTSA